MDQFDSNGWDNVHSAAYKGFIHSLEKLLEKQPEKLELSTMDELRSTPFLLAVMSGNLKTVQELIKLGAQIHTRNSQGHGLIEIICLRKDIAMLTYFLDTTEEDVLPVWIHLVNFMNSLDDEESIRASYCINEIFIINKSKEPRHPYEERSIDADIITTIIKINKGTQGYECKQCSLVVLRHLIIYQTVRKAFVQKSGIEALLPLLRPPSNAAIAVIVIEIFNVLVVEPDGFSENLFHSGVINDMNRILEWSTISLKEKYEFQHENDDGHGTDVNGDDHLNKQLRTSWYNTNLLKEIVELLGNLSEINPSYQSSIGREVACLSRIGKLFAENVNRNLLIELTNCVAKLSFQNSANQNVFMNDNVEDFLINLTRAKDQTIQLAAVNAIMNLTENNPDYQNQLMAKEAHKPLLGMLRKSGRNIMIKEKTSSALWLLAGDTRESKAYMASLIEIDLLINFLLTSSNILQLIGSESIFVLSGGPTSQRDAIGKKNGIQPLVFLLKSSIKDIVLSCIRSLRQLCIKLGYVPHPRNQQLVKCTGGLQILVDLMRFDEDELIQVEAAYAIASVTMRNGEALAELHSNVKFNYVYILEKMYSSISKVRLLAGASLAAFAYNNPIEQKKIASYGGIRFKCLHPFLFADDEYERCLSAFQVIILSRVIPDEDVAITTAIGMKILIKTLAETKNCDVQELGCDCIARLCHSKSGVANAMISFGIVEILCRLMISYIDSVKGSAAIAAEYLSHYPEARRQILRKCRLDPYLMRVIMFYNKDSRIDPDFIEGWKHYKRVGLPKIEANRPFLTTRKEIDLFKDLNERQITMFSSSDDFHKTGSFTERQVVKKQTVNNFKLNTVPEGLFENNNIVNEKPEIPTINTV